MNSNPNPPGVDFLSVGEAATISLETFRSNRADQLLVDSMRGLALSPAASPSTPSNPVETTADGFENFDKFWHALPFTSPLSSDENDIALNYANDKDISAYDANYDDAALPSTPVPDNMEVELSEYELEIDSNASTPAHVRAEREAEIERLRIEEEERQEKLRQEKEKAELEAKVKEALQIKAEEEQKMKEEEEERKRVAEEEERIRIAEEKSQAAQAKKEQLKAMAQSVLEEERQLPERRNSSWTKEATARKSILKNRHSIAPIAQTLVPIVEDEKENNSPRGPQESPPLVDYDSESSYGSKRSSMSSRRTSVTIDVMKSSKSKRKSMSAFTQTPLVDYPKTPKRFSLAYSTTASSPGSSVADSINRGEPEPRKTIRRRLEEDMEENVGISVLKLERIRRASEVAPPPRVTEKGTMFRESLDAPEMANGPRPKTKNLIDCGIMCEPDLIEAEMAIMFAQFDVTAVDGADIPPITASQKKEASEPSIASPSPQMPKSPQVTLVEQAISIQTPGKTISHEMLNSLMTKEPPSSAVRPTEKLLSQVGEGADALIVVEVARSPEPATPTIVGNGIGSDTPNTGLATMASSGRDSIMSPPEIESIFSSVPPSSGRASRRKRGKKNTTDTPTPANTPADSEARKNRLMVSGAKPPKSPKSPSFAALSSTKRTRRSLRFQNSSPSPAGTPVGMDDDDDDNQPIELPSDLTPSENMVNCASFSIPQNRLSMQTASGGMPFTLNSVSHSPGASSRGSGRSRRRGSRRSTSHSESQKTSKRVSRRSSRTLHAHQVVDNVVGFDFPATEAVAAARTSTYAMNASQHYENYSDDDDDVDNGEDEDDVDIQIVERTSKNISKRTSSTSTIMDSKSSRSRTTRSSKSSKRGASGESSISTAPRRSTRSNTKSKSSSPSTVQNSTETNGLRRSSRRTTVASSANITSLKNQRRGTIVQAQEEIINISDDEPLALMSNDEASSSEASSGITRRANGNSGGSKIAVLKQKSSNARGGRKRMRRSIVKQEITRKKTDEDDEDSRRGKRARFQPLKFWQGEKPLYERRRSQQLPTIKELALSKEVVEEEEEAENEERIDLPILPQERGDKQEDFELEGEEEEVVEVEVSNFPPDDPQSPEDHGHGMISEVKQEVVEDERSARRSARKKRKTTETVSQSTATESKTKTRRGTKATRAATTTTTTTSTRSTSRRGRSASKATAKSSEEVEVVATQQAKKKRNPRKRRG